MAFQFHLIVWIDWVCQFQRDNLKAHDRFPLKALKVKLTWSKNVLDERNLPWQTILGSIDMAFCILFNLAVWLELTSCRFSPYVFNFSEDMTVPSGGTKAKNRAMDVLRDVFRALELDIGDGEVRTHSICKCASTHVQANGVSKDDKATRGRWKVTARVSDRYDSVDLPYVDSKVAVSLCIGGACTYNLSKAVAPQFFLQYIAPEINTQYGLQVALVLGAALMWWGCFDASVSHLVPLFIKDRVVSAYPQAELPEGNDLVQRCLVIVIGDNETVLLTQLLREEEVTRRGGAGGSRWDCSRYDSPLMQMRQCETQME
jgi:hypothetical protein